MPIQIEGMRFTGFPGFDAQNLRRLTYDGRVQWLDYRMNLVFLKPFSAIIKKEKTVYVWLCVLNLMCSAIEALASFEFDGNGKEKFRKFVQRHFKRRWKTAKLKLHDPTLGRQPVTCPADHFYKFFRCGLAHSFCIEWGGILHREDGALSYLFEARTGAPGLNSLGIVPRELADDFLNALNKFFVGLRSGGRRGPRRKIFDRRFEQVFMQKEHRPLP